MLAAQPTLNIIVDQTPSRIQTIRMLEIFISVNAIMRRHNIGFPGLLILLILEHGQERMVDIARDGETSTAAATAMVDSLFKKGFVERIHDPDDRRQVYARLTETGRAIVANANLVLTQLKP